MRIFNHPNLSASRVCPVCGESTDRPVILAGIDGTSDGHIMEAQQVHVDCIELNIVDIGKGERLLYMRFLPKEKK